MNSTFLLASCSATWDGVLALKMSIITLLQWLVSYLKLWTLSTRKDYVRANGRSKASEPVNVVFLVTVAKAAVVFTSQHSWQKLMDCRTMAVKESLTADSVTYITVMKKSQWMLSIVPCIFKADLCYYTFFFFLNNFAFAIFFFFCPDLSFAVIFVIVIAVGWPAYFFNLYSLDPNHTRLKECFLSGQNRTKRAMLVWLKRCEVVQSVILHYINLYYYSYFDYYHHYY